MPASTRPLLTATTAMVLAASLFTGCDKKFDPITQAEQADKKASIEAPGIAEVKAIAEEGFRALLLPAIHRLEHLQLWLRR